MWYKLANLWTIQIVHPIGAGSWPSHMGAIKSWYTKIKAMGTASNMTRPWIFQDWPCLWMFMDVYHGLSWFIQFFQEMIQLWGMEVWSLPPKPSLSSGEAENVRGIQVGHEETKHRRFNQHCPHKNVDDVFTKKIRESKQVLATSWILGTIGVLHPQVLVRTPGKVRVISGNRVKCMIHVGR